MSDIKALLAKVRSLPADALVKVDLAPGVYITLSVSELLDFMAPYSNLKSCHDCASFTEHRDTSFCRNDEEPWFDNWAEIADFSDFPVCATSCPGFEPANENGDH